MTVSSLSKLLEKVAILEPRYAQISTRDHIYWLTLVLQADISLLKKRFMIAKTIPARVTRL